MTGGTTSMSEPIWWMVSFTDEWTSFAPPSPPEKDEFRKLDRRFFNSSNITVGPLVSIIKVYGVDPPYGFSPKKFLIATKWLKSATSVLKEGTAVTIKSEDGVKEVYRLACDFSDNKDYVAVVNQQHEMCFFDLRRCQLYDEKMDRSPNRSKSLSVVKPGEEE